MYLHGRSDPEGIRVPCLIIFVDHALGYIPSPGDPSTGDDESYAEQNDDGDALLAWHVELRYQWHGQDRADEISQAIDDTDGQCDRPLIDAGVVWSAEGPVVLDRVALKYRQEEGSDHD